MHGKLKLDVQLNDSEELRSEKREWDSGSASTALFTPPFQGLVS
jgi:hypothetical protein